MWCQVKIELLRIFSIISCRWASVPAFAISSDKWGLCGKNEHYTVARVALLERNVRLVKSCYGVVAFIDKNSRGSISTIKQAIKQRKKVVVFPIDCDPLKINDIVWSRIKCTGPWAVSYVAKTIYDANS
ncbi:hypothetical protein HOH45_05485 [bacterium]|jgi:hypothetical protein|nr:hypothetical protein [bacterium]